MSVMMVDKEDSDLFRFGKPSEILEQSGHFNKQPCSTMR